MSEQGRDHADRMQLGVTADTHDDIEAVERAVSVFEERGVSTVIHCGDIATPETAALFEGFEFHAVLGNNDEPYADELESTIADLGNDSAFHGLFADLEFDGTRLAVLHGVVERQIYEHARKGVYDYVLHGHFHETEETTVGGTTVINPGAHRSVVVLDTREDRVEFVPLE